MIMTPTRITFIVPTYRHRPRPHYFPLGYAYLIANIRKRFANRVKVTLVNHDFKPQFAMDQVIRDTIRTSPDIICLGGLITLFSYVKQLVPQLKKQLASCPVILGGGLNSAPELVMQVSGGDFLVMGEGEESLGELLAILLDQRDACPVIPGVYTRSKEGKIEFGGHRPEIEDLDSLAFPELNVTRAADYYAFHGEHGILATRSCPFKCAFCYNPYGRKFRKRSIDNIIEEIMYVHHRYGFSHFEFYDDLFIFHKPYVMEFCEKILLAGNGKISFGCCGRVNTADPELFRFMYRAGCRRINFGFESGNDENLRRMNKNAKIEQAEAAIRYCREAGIEPSSSFIIGNLDESEAMIRDTQDFILRNRLYPGAINLMTPFPGTPLYQSCLEHGLIDDPEKHLDQLGNVTDFTISLNGMRKERLLELRDEIYRSVKEKLKAEKIPFRQFYAKNFIAVKYQCSLCHRTNYQYRRISSEATELVINCTYCHYTHLLNTSQAPAFSLLDLLRFVFHFLHPRRLFPYLKRRFRKQRAQQQETIQTL